MANKAMIALVLVLPIPFSACAQDVVDEVDPELDRCGKERSNRESEGPAACRSGG